jgi:putative methionine-R-sulfoxide reductase with GAF domain
MTIPPRRATPALLQIDSIQRRLHGGEATAEICRFLLAEFAHFRWVAAYRVEGAVLLLDGQAGEPKEAPESVPLGEGFLGGAVRDAVTRTRGPATPLPTEDPEIAAPILTAGVGVGLLVVTGATASSLDASDARFLEHVAAKLSPEMALPRARLL